MLFPIAFFALALGTALTETHSASLSAIFPAPNHLEYAEGYLSGVSIVRYDGSFSDKDCAWLTLSTQEFVSKGPGEMAFRLDPKIEGPEAYRLKVTPKGIEASASTTRGLFWSLQTLRQLHTDAGYPCVTIDDSPRFGWRGVLLDEGRHFMGEKFVKHLLDVLSLYKFNVLHWHLTEDQGWRIEIKSHPELTKVGAWRTEPDGSRSGGYYTQKQIKEIVAYAAKRNISIMPEIEMPGHCSAAVASNPELGCTRQQIQVPSSWGVFPDAYCAGRESTFKFLDDVLTEVTALFPYECVHIGGDEVPKDRWHACPDCQLRMKTEGLKNEEELQSYFIRRIQKMLADKGRMLAGWDEIMEGGLAKGAIVQVWRDQVHAKTATDEGNPVILSTESCCYLNSPASDLKMEKVYSYSPLDGITKTDLVKGIETTLWSEHITTRNCLAMLMPRGLAISELAWSEHKDDYASFRDRVKRHLPFMRSQGIEYGPEDKQIVHYEVTSHPDRGVCSLRIEFGMPGFELRYTLDGTSPTGSSPTAGAILEWPLGKSLHAIPYLDGKPYEEISTFQTTRHLGLGKSVQLLTQPSPRYNKAGPQGLADGLLGTSDFHDGLWLGWDGNDLAAEIDLAAPTEIHELGLHCLQAMPSWILMPTTVRYETSADGQTWTLFGEVQNTVSDRERAQIETWFTERGPGPVTARYVRVMAKNYGKLPSWHLGAGKDAFVFADELAIK